MYQNELYHYGVKGMKWGRRKDPDTGQSISKRNLRKKMRSDDQKFRKENTAKEYKKRNIDGLEKEAIAYGKKHKLDLDDGGGGSIKAGNTYMNKWENIEKQRDAAEWAASKAAGKQMIAKYGKEEVDSLRKHDNRKAMAMVGAVFATPFVLVAGATISDMRR